MGCSQAKTAQVTSRERQPKSAFKMHKANISARPSPTLLDPSPVQEQKGERSCVEFSSALNSISSSSRELSSAHVHESCGQKTVNMLGQIEAMREFRESASPHQVTAEALLAWTREIHGAAPIRSAPQSSSTACPLRAAAMRVFAMADKGATGLLNPAELLQDSCKKAFVEMLESQSVSDFLDGHEARLVSCSQWLQMVRKAALKDMVQTALFLDLCQQHAGDRMESFGLRSKALDVFRMGDRNGDGQLDMDELTEIRQSAAFAEAMMDNADIDKSGTVSKGEWLAYVKRLADKNEKSATAVLALYMKHLSNGCKSGNSSNTCDIPKSLQTHDETATEIVYKSMIQDVIKEVCVAAKVDVQVDEIGVKPVQWWACY